MTPTLLLLLDLPAGVTAHSAALSPCGLWRIPSALAAADLATILTDAPATVHGVLDEWELRPDGQHVRASPRHRLMHAPWWESVPGAVAVGLPWSTGSRGPGCVVSAEFAELAGPGAQAALPGRVWPPGAAGQLAPLRLMPDELDDATLAQLGYAPNARQEVAAWLSLHMIATARLEQRDAPLALVRLALATSPQYPAATSAFISAAIARYRALWAGRLLILTRMQEEEHTVCQLYADSTDGCVHAIADARALARAIGFPAAPGVVLPASHWEQLRARHAVPDQTLPGTAGAISALTARLSRSLQLLGL